MDMVIPPATVLCVCTGNICRSPAMELFLARAWGADAVVKSAGTMAAVGWHIPDPMQRAEHEIGLDGSHHHPTQLDVAAVEHSDLLLIAAGNHRAWIQHHVGAVPPNTFLLTEATALTKVARRPAGTNRADSIATAASLLDAARTPDGGPYPDIDDPYGHGDDAYVRAMTEIAAALTALVDWVG